MKFCNIIIEINNFNMSFNLGIIIKNGKKLVPLTRYKWSNENSEYISKLEYVKINEFVKMMNNIKCSNNPIDVLNSFTISDEILKSSAVQYSLIYNSIFKGDIENESTTEILRYIGCTKHPENSPNIKKTILQIKIKLFEFKEKWEKDEICAEWVGILSGLALYFNNLDTINYNQTNYYDMITKPFLEDDIIKL